MMDYDKDKLDEIVLALLYLNSYEDKFGPRAWKSLDWVAMDRLHEKGLISDPKSKAKSVILMDEGFGLGKEFFEKYFGIAED